MRFCLSKATLLASFMVSHTKVLPQTNCTTFLRWAAPALTCMTSTSILAPGTSLSRSFRGGTWEHSSDDNHWHKSFCIFKHPKKKSHACERISFISHPSSRWVGRSHGQLAPPWWNRYSHGPLSLWPLRWRSCSGQTPWWQPAGTSYGWGCTSQTDDHTGKKRKKKSSFSDQSQKVKGLWGYVCGNIWHIFIIIHILSINYIVT